ncbi:ABC1 kinase family protein [Sphingobium sp.]|uniref:ABC1 kinase family protein n=1 Tax=Sphingobium sp. TaxID=1912891 RepID=UPI0035C6D18F
MFETMTVASRDRARVSEIGAVIAHFGLESLLARLGLSNSENETASEEANLPTRVRRALEMLGPTYIKLGQILATRRDILPPEWITAFEKLHSDAPRLPFETLRESVEAALGEPPEHAFARFDPEPLAAASIAQVHRASLHDGSEVVVKVRRPAIRKAMEADLRLLRHLAVVLEQRNAAARRMKPSAMIEQLGREILDELDFTNEGRNADILRADLATVDQVVVPRIHWQYTSEAVLVMEYVEGIAPGDPDRLKAAGVDPSAIARLGARLVLEMVLVNGRFHADPHPGNLLCLPPDGEHDRDRLALLDLGSVGFVSPRRQHEFLTFLLSLRGNDPSGVADMLAAWSQSGDVPRERLLAAAERLVARHGTGALVLDAMVADFFPLLRREGLVLPPDLVLIFKAMVTMDGVLARLVPGFDLSEALGELRGRLVASRLSRLAAPERIESLLLEVSRLSAEAPALMRAVTARVNMGDEPRKDTALVAAIRRAGALLACAIFFHALALLAVGFLS